MSAQIINSPETFQLTNSICIPNCPDGVKEADLVSLFAEFGVKEVHLLKNSNTPQRAYLKLKDVKTAVEASEKMNNFDLNGVHLRVYTQDDRSLRKKSPNQMHGNQSNGRRAPVRNNGKGIFDFPPHQSILPLGEPWQHKTSMPNSHHAYREDTYLGNMQPGSHQFPTKPLPPGDVPLESHQFPTHPPPLILPPYRRAHSPPPLLIPVCEHRSSASPRDDDMPPLLRPFTLSEQPCQCRQPANYQEPRPCCNHQDLQPTNRAHAACGNGGCRLTDRWRPDSGNHQMPSQHNRRMLHLQRRRPHHPDGNGCVVVNVTNFPPHTRKAELYELFQEFEPLGVNILVNDPEPDQFTQALVVLPNKDYAEAAVMELDNTWFNKNILVVEEIDEDEDEDDS